MSSSGGPNAKPILMLRRNMTPDEQKRAKEQHAEALKRWREKNKN